MDKYELVTTPYNESPLFYSADTNRDQETGCIGHMRLDFGRNGDEFWHTWTDHCSELNTQTFKDDFKNVIDSLRESFLTNLSSMSSYCYNNPQAKLIGGRDSNYGFKVQTNNYVYYLRCSTLKGDYNLYCYGYERGKLEKALQPTVQSAIDSDLESKLENAARYIIEKSAKETTSGNYITYKGDVPEDIISPDLFSKHIRAIADIMEEYEAVADVIVEDDSIDTNMYLAYCPNYEPWEEEQDEYPDNRKILDPLKTYNYNIVEIRKCVENQEFPEGLSEGDTLYFRIKDNHYIDVTLNYDSNDNLAIFYEIGRMKDLGAESEESVDILPFNINAGDIEKEMYNLIDEYIKERNCTKDNLDNKSTRSAVKPSLMDRVEKGKEKAAQQEQPDKIKNKKEVLE